MRQNQLRPKQPSQRRRTTRKAQCESLFPRSEVSRIVGKGEMVFTTPGFKKRPQDLVCAYETPGGGKSPVATVGLRVKCGPSQSSKKMMAAAFQKNKGFEETEDGIYHIQVRSHQFLAFPQDPKCNVIVTTGFMEERKVDELAKMVVGRLNASNAPQ